VFPWFSFQGFPGSRFGGSEPRTLEQELGNPWNAEAGNLPSGHHPSDQSLPLRGHGGRGLRTTYGGLVQ
jgi:hypothetical protein